MKLYTKQGDTGETGLFGGMRVSKAALRVDAYGEVDELNANIGLAAASCQSELHVAIEHALLEIQSRLFDLGADLATPPDSPGREHIVPLPATAVDRLERWIDDAEGQLEPLRTFILPGGSELAARLHLARTVCRRAERAVVRLRDTLAKADGLGEVEPTPDSGGEGNDSTAAPMVAQPAERRDEHLEALARPIVYLNRLSDLLFAFARLANRVQNIDDIAWQSPKRPGAADEKSQTPGD